MNKKANYRLWRFLNNLHHGNQEVQGYAEMLSLKRTWKRQGYKVEVDKLINGRWETIESRR